MLRSARAAQRPYAIALESELRIFSAGERLGFQAVLWPLVTIGALGNAAVLWRIALAPGGRFALLRPFYRCALFSFACSDLLLLAASGCHTLAKLASGVGLLWSLPDWTCAAIPYLQTLAVLAGSLTLAAIAVDRYRALIPKCPTNEKPKWSYAVASNVFIWFFAMAASYPVIGIYEIHHLTVIRDDYTMYDGRLCSTDQARTGLVYAALFVAIFGPLALIFLAVHVLLALNIWRRQQKQQHQHQQRSSNKSRLAAGSDSQSSEFSTVSSEARPRRGQPVWSGTSGATRRRRRTLRVVLALMLVFLLSRLPSWAFLLWKQHARLAGPGWHHLQTGLTGLTFLGAALDPFLYAFLCEALSLIRLLRACCSGNPTTGSPEMTAEMTAEPRPRVDPVIVPRGPYSL